MSLKLSKQAPPFCDTSLYSVREVADILNYHPNTIRRHMREGILGRVQAGAGRRIRFTGAELNRVYASTTSAPQAIFSARGRATSKKKAVQRRGRRNK